MTPESKLKANCKKIAQEFECKLYPASFKGRKGLPDYLLLCPARALVFVEFKAEGTGVLSIHQVSSIIDLRMAGGEVWVIYNVLQFRDQLTRVIDERPIRLG